jgi:hypothetical protein
MAHLGRVRGLHGLREKTVTMQTRYALRNLYGHGRVAVSCTAEFNGFSWSDEWRLDGKLLKCVVGDR